MPCIPHKRARTIQRLILPRIHFPPKVKFPRSDGYSLAFSFDHHRQGFIGPRLATHTHPCSAYSYTRVAIGASRMRFFPSVQRVLQQQNSFLEAPRRNISHSSSSTRNFLSELIETLIGRQQLCVTQRALTVAEFQFNLRTHSLEGLPWCSVLCYNIVLRYLHFPCSNYSDK